jgi:hypothetical protein
VDLVKLVALEQNFNGLLSLIKIILTSSRLFRQTQDKLSLAESLVNSTVETTASQTQDSSRQTQDKLSLAESLVNSTVETIASQTQTFKTAFPPLQNWLLTLCLKMN